MYEAEVIIVGAGVAGLGAAWFFSRSAVCKKVVVLEARERVGGRVCELSSEELGLGEGCLPVELGAEFVHGSDTTTTKLLRRIGIPLYEFPRHEKKHFRWKPKFEAKALTEDELPQEEAALISFLVKDQFLNKEFTARYNDLHQRSVRQLLEEIEFPKNRMEMAEVLAGQTCCTALKNISVREEYGLQCGDKDYRIEGGYRQLINYLAKGIDIRLGHIVKNIVWKNQRVEVTTTQGVFVGKACIVTLPISLLQNSTVRFDPPLPAWKQEAISAFRFEGATKVILRFNQYLWEENMLMLAHEGTYCRWWTLDYGKRHSPGCIPIATTYVTADRAEVVDEMAEDEVISGALQEFASLLGFSFEKVNAHFVCGKRVSWKKDPFTRGGYSVVPPLPFNIDIRKQLAEPLDSKLFFAGEATAFHSAPQTVHGALDSGLRAAQEFLQHSHNLPSYAKL